MHHTFLQRLLACAIAIPLSVCSSVFAQTSSAETAAPAVTLLNRCSQGDQSVWPTVEAYAAIKGYPPSSTAMGSYRYLVLRILEMCNDGDTLVLGDSAGDAAPIFRRLMVEFCADEDIKVTPIPVVDSVRRPNAASLSCKVTKIDALKGRPAGMPPASMTLVLPRPADQKP